MYFKVFVCHNIFGQDKLNGDFVFFRLFLFRCCVYSTLFILRLYLIRQVQSHRYCFLVFWLFDHETIPVGTQ